MQDAAKRYRLYEKKKSIILAKRYTCDDPNVKGICKLEKCSKYGQCRKDAKINYEIWRDAYSKDNKDLMKILKMGGGDKCIQNWQKFKI